MNDYKFDSTSVVSEIFLQDSNSVIGAGRTGLLYNTSGLTCYYKRTSGSASVQVTLANITTLGTFVSGGFKEVDAVNMPGLYEFHPPDAAFATGSKEVFFYFRGVTGLIEKPIKYRVITFDLDSGYPDVNIKRIDNSNQAAVNAGLFWKDGIITGIVDASPTAAAFKSTISVSATADFVNGSVLTFTSGILKGIARKITDYDESISQFSFSGASGSADAAFPASPSPGDTFMILGRIG